MEGTFGKSVEPKEVITGICPVVLVIIVAAWNSLCLRHGLGFSWTHALDF
jgi:hypothetical protein